MSTLSESLAKGLASRFITEHRARALSIEHRIKILRRNIPVSGFVKRSSWKTFTQNLADILRDALVSEAEYGSRKRQTFIFHYLGAAVTNPSVDWQENALPIRFLTSTSPYGLVPSACRIRCFVGEHALARVFQRLGVPDSDACVGGGVNPTPDGGARLS